MKNYLVSLVRNQNNKLVKFRYLEVKDDYKTITNKILIVNGKETIKLENAKFTKNKLDLEGTNGSIDRYPTLYTLNNKYENEKSIIILCRTLYNSEKGFCISDNKGNISFLSEKEALKTAKSKGIANGKVVSDSFISAIRGEFELISKIDALNDSKNLNISNNKSENSVKVITEIKDIIYGLNLVKKYKPYNIEQYIGENNWIDLITAYKNNLDLHKEEFDNCVLTLDRAKSIIESIRTDSANNSDYFAQILKAKNLNLTPKGM